VTRGSRVIPLFESRSDGSIIMTRDPLADVSIDSTDEFRAVLAAAVEKAVKANVDVRGAWEFRTKGSTHDWEVETIELARDDDADE
jgi:hypothetical protein